MITLRHPTTILRLLIVGSIYIICVHPWILLLNVDETSTPCLTLSPGLSTLPPCTHTRKGITCLAVGAFATTLLCSSRVFFSVIKVHLLYVIIDGREGIGNLIFPCFVITSYTYLRHTQGSDSIAIATMQ